MLKIALFNQQRDLPLSSISVKKIVRALLEKEGVYTDEIALYFVSKRKIGLLHAQFFSDSSPTDCITLPMDKPQERLPYHILGEIFICPRLAIDFVHKSQKSSYTQEVRLYLIHGLLHLLGYRDESAQEKQKMRTKEKQLERFLDKKGLFLL